MFPLYSENPNDASRLRSLARSLHVRLYVSAAGRIFAVRGRPAYAALAACLAKIAAVPTAAEAPTPLELGIEATDGELTARTLASIGQALDLWRQKLCGRPPRKPAPRREQVVAAESQELAVLGGRLAMCRQWSAQAAGGGEPAGAPYLLGEAAEDVLRQTLSSAQAAAHSPLHNWLARLVLWLAGPRALTRFVAAAAEIPVDPLTGQQTHSLLAAVAAAVACDGGVAPLPKRVLQAGVNYTTAALAVLVAQRGQRGYDALLGVLDQLPNLPLTRQFDSVRRLVERGLGLANMAWACERHLVVFLAESSLPVLKVRAAADQFAAYGLPVEGADLFALVDALTKQPQETLIRRWLEWTQRWPAQALPPRLRKVLQSALADCVLPALRRPWEAACVEQWLEAQPASAAPLSRDPQACLAQIAACQRLLGQQPSVPQSFQKRSGSKLPRATTAAAVMAAVQALRMLLRRAGEAEWRQAASISPPEHSAATPNQLAGWIADMTAAERNWLREVTAAWQAAGSGYKRTLAGNRDWLAQAAAAGIDLTCWVDSEATTVSIDGQPVEIGLAGDPRDVFLMGNYFRTCLSLGGLYQMSPLANAYDANKQVVLAVGRTPGGKRHVLARQLIAISPAWQLIGYRCYRAYGRQQTAEREACLAAMAEYCGRLARRCGLALGSEGEPALLSTDRWHDDGVFGWHAAAHRGWEASQPPPGSLQPHVWLCLSV